MLYSADLSPYMFGAHFIVKSADTGVEFSGRIGFLNRHDGVKIPGMYVVIDEAPPARKLFGPIYPEDIVMDPETRKPVELLHI